MVHRPTRRAARTTLGNHNRAWIWGRNVVLETLRAGQWAVWELACSDKLDPSVRAEVTRWADQHHVAVSELTNEQLEQRCRAGDHQGLAARMHPFPYRPLSALLQLPKQTKRGVLVVLLDRLQDPFNVGAIIRSAAGLGAAGVVLGEQSQAEINSLAARSSAGSVNHLPIVRCPDLLAAAREFQAAGFRVVAASEKAAQSVSAVSLTGKVVLVIGNEGVGIQPALLDLADDHVAIPLAPGVGSLNAAISASILLYEAWRQAEPPSGPAH